MTAVKTTPDSGNTAVNGHCDARFAAVRDCFQASFERGEPRETGAAVAACVDGHWVIDLWGGHAHAPSGRLWQRDTANCVFSCTKGVLALLAATLVDRGRLDYERPVAAYWPEFAAHGKEQLSVAQLLSHQAGLPMYPASLSADELCDWRGAARALAAAKPIWTPGSRHGYHALSWGNLVGTVLERAGGGPLPELLQTQLCAPLGVNFQLGTGGGGAASFARLDAPGIAGRSQTMPDGGNQALLLTPAVADSAAWRRATWPGAGGFCTARDLAGLYQAALDRSNPLLQPATLGEATRMRCSGRDAVLGQQIAFAAGFQRPTAEVTPGHPGIDSAWGHRGIYGSTAFADPGHGVAFAYTMNRCADPLGDERTLRLTEALYGCLR